MMASSNRHWTSIFKSKPFDHSPPHYQRRYDAAAAAAAAAAGERIPEAKPRWNPKPEQVRILEAVFNSGMVNPPRDEIRKIRVQLQQYGQVGDANVFYWFQNRKSRTKLKQQRHRRRQQPTPPAASTSSSTDDSNGTTRAKKQPSPFSADENDFFAEPTMPFPAAESWGFPPEAARNPNNYGRRPMNLDFSSSVSEPEPACHFPFEGLEEEAGVTKSMVSINDVWFEIEGPFNVREAFGDGVTMVESNGAEVITDESGFALQPFRTLGSYYLIFGSKQRSY